MQLAGLVRYEWAEQVFNGNLALELNANYSFSFFHNVRNFQAHKISAYLLGNAQLSWRSQDTHWEGTFFIRNIGDERYRINGFDLATLCGCQEEAYGNPHWFGAKIRYNF